MKKRRLFWLLGAMVFVSLSFSACGGDRTEGREQPAGLAASTAGSAAAAISPCALISQAQVEEIFAEPFQEGEDRSRDGHPLGQRICFWNTAKRGSFRFLQVSIIKASTIPDGRFPGAAAIFQQTREALTPTSDVAGVADKAFWGTMGLHLLQRDTYIQIAVGSSDRPGNLEIAKKAAAIILPRL